MQRVVEDSVEAERRALLAARMAAMRADVDAQVGPGLRRMGARTAAPGHVTAMNMCVPLIRHQVSSERELYRARVQPPPPLITSPAPSAAAAAARGMAHPDDPHGALSAAAAAAGRPSLPIPGSSSNLEDLHASTSVWPTGPLPAISPKLPASMQPPGGLPYGSPYTFPHAHYAATGAGGMASPAPAQPQGDLQLLQQQQQQLAAAVAAAGAALPYMMSGAFGSGGAAGGQQELPYGGGTAPGVAGAVAGMPDLVSLAENLNRSLQLLLPSKSGLGQGKVPMLHAVLTWFKHLPSAACRTFHIHGHQLPCARTAFPAVAQANKQQQQQQSRQAPGGPAPAGVLQDQLSQGLVGFGQQQQQHQQQQPDWAGAGLPTAAAEDPLLSRVSPGQRHVSGHGTLLIPPRAM